MRLLVAIVFAWQCGMAFSQSADAEMRAARARWQTIPHGEMLARIIPPYLEPSRLPEPGSAGAHLAARYCVQCHNLASPAMHHAEKWPEIVLRMLPRMQGRGNRGSLMRELMVDLRSPEPVEVRILVAYLQKHAQSAVDPDALPEAGRSSAWSSYNRACTQCHTLPDPRRHTREEWPAVLARMEKNMQWMNRVTGSKPDPQEPQYRGDEILGYLQRYARR